jgi:glucose uptake protein GlcU
MQRVVTFTSLVTPNNSIAGNSTLPEYSGFLLLVGSSFLFGSNYLPVKSYETGDGMFFQLILSVAVWTVGFGVNWLRQFPKFELLPMLGGALWATGNVNTVPVIRCIGMAMGMIFQNTISEI